MKEGVKGIGVSSACVVLGRFVLYSSQREYLDTEVLGGGLCRVSLCTRVWNEIEGCSKTRDTGAEADAGSLYSISQMLAR